MDMGEHSGRQTILHAGYHSLQRNSKGNAVDLKLDLPNRQPLLDSERLMRWTPIPKHVIEVGLFGSGLFDWQFLFIADAAPRAVGDVGAWLLAHLYLYPEFPGLHAAEFDLSMSSLAAYIGSRKFLVRPRHATFRPLSRTIAKIIEVYIGVTVIASLISALIVSIAG